MPFRESEYKESCFACRELTDFICEFCHVPACSEHHDAEMCGACRDALNARLAEAGLNQEDLKFRPVLDDTASREERAIWEAHTQRVYQGRFIVARFVRERSRGK